MPDVDYAASAEVYASNQNGTKRYMTHRRFGTTAEALQYAVEELPAGAKVVMEVDEERFEGESILALYRADGYPLPRAAARS